MDSNNDPSFFALGGTAGVNDEVRRKEEAEAREIEAITKRTNDKVKEEGSNHQELLKSEKHAYNEAREMLQTVRDQIISVDMDCGIVKSFNDSVINTYLSGSNISEQAREKGMKGILESAREHEASIQELQEQLEKRTNELSITEKRNAKDFEANADLLDTIANKIKACQKEAKDKDLEGNEALTKQRSMHLQTTKTELASKLQIPLQKTHEIAIENKAIRDKDAATTAALREAKVTNATLIAQLGNEKSSLLGQKQVILQEIEQARETSETAEADFGKLAQQLTSTKNILQDRIKLEEEAKAIRAKQCELSAEKKRLEQEIETAGKMLSDARLKSEQVNVIAAKVGELTVEIEKLEEEYPTARFEESIENKQLAHKEFQDMHKKFAETANVEEAHQNDCAEQRLLIQELKDTVEKARLKKKELLETLEATDLAASALATELDELKSDNTAKEAAKKTMETTAFDNHAHQELVRKYKVFKAARKNLDLAASLDAKIASAKAEIKMLAK